MFFCGGLVRLVAGRPCRCGIHRGAWRFWSPPYLPLALFLAPYPPDPLPQWGRGRFLLYFAGGFAPGTPALNRLRHLQNLPSRYPAGCLPSLPPAYPAFSLLYCPHPPDPLPGGKGEIQSIFRRGLPPPAPLQPGGKRHWFFLQLALWFGSGTGEQCRQPRRGGTGGDGTIRRKRRRRLRWSSPPGLGEQVPPGAYLFGRLPTLPLACFSAPIPPTPFPSGEGGD